MLYYSLSVESGLESRQGGSELLHLQESCEKSITFLLKLYNQKCKGMHKKCKLNGSKFGIIAFVSRFTFRDICGRGLLKQHEGKGFDLSDEC